MQGFGPGREERLAESGWRPAVDVYRCRAGWLLKFDLAGVRPQDIEIHVSEKWLTVTGIRRDWAMEEAERYHSLEIAYHRFQRSVELPVSLERAEIASDYRDGMLLVRLQWKNT